MGLASSVGSVVGGLITSGRKLPTMDLAPLFAEIDKAGADREKLIKQLPEDLKPLYAQYQESLGKAGTDLKESTTNIGQKLLEETKALYGPDSDAVKATLAALKQEDYSTLPGTLTNLKAQLAATGGLSRGGAGRAITEAVLTPAQAYSQQAANVMGQQLTTQQQNTQAALNKIASLDEATAQQLFGMSTTEATNILQYGREDLKNQLTDLINNINTVSGQKLGALGIAADVAFKNAQTRNAQQEAVTNALVNTGVDLASNYATSGLSNLMPGSSSAASPASVSQYGNVASSGTSFPGALTL